LLKRIYQGLRSGAVLVLSEKINFEDELTQQTMTDLYQGFKKLQGYSDLEISQKRTALENVLIPDTRELHHKRLAECGFEQVFDCFQCLNFQSFLAVKS